MKIFYQLGIMIRWDIVKEIFVRIFFQLNEKDENRFQQYQPELKEEKSRIIGFNKKENSEERNEHGLLGLLKIINTGSFQNNTNIQKLALGFDLTTLGLNLNSTEYLHSTFSSPCAENKTDQIVKPDYKIPKCYLKYPMKDAQFFDKFIDETLFYVFYAMPRDILQVEAAKELIRRDWEFHKSLKIWMKSLKIYEKNQRGEKGDYYYFDIDNWEKKVRKNYEFENKEKFKFTELM